MRELVILSGKGGTGKTSITAAFASLAQNMVLCDADVDAADLHLILKPDFKHTMEFKGGHKAPKFTRRSRKAILDCGELDWSEINPDIFGSMIQAVVRGHEEDDNTKHSPQCPIL